MAGDVSSPDSRPTPVARSGPALEPDGVASCPRGRVAGAEHAVRPGLLRHLRRRAVADVVDPEIPPIGEAHRHRGRGPGPSGGDELQGTCGTPERARAARV